MRRVVEEREVDVDELARGAREERVVHDLEQAGADAAGDAAAVDEAVGVEQREVARDDGGADPVVLGVGIRLPRGERPVAEDARDVRQSPAHEVAVDDVVVHAQRRVQQLERGADARGRLEVTAPERLVGREHHARPEPLAAGRRRLDGVPQRGICKPQRLGALAG